MGVTNINEYIQKVQPYPSFQEKYILHDTGDAMVMKYSYFGVEGEQKYQTPVLESFEHFTSFFDINICQMQTRLQDLQTRVEACEDTEKNHLNKHQKRFTEMINLQMADFEQCMTTKMEETIEAHTLLFAASLQQQMDTKLSETSTNFESQLSTITVSMLQDIYDAAEDGRKALVKSMEEHLQDFKAILAVEKANIIDPNATTGNIHQAPPPTVSPTQAKRFAHVRVNPYFKPSPNPYDVPDSMTSLPGNVRQMSPDQAHPSLHQSMDNAPVPSTVHAPSTYGLPPVNHDQALKRARIQFTGLGDIFVFYNQLMNALEQFGIYLISLSTVKYQTSLCPTTHRGFPLNEYCRQNMASTLYQKLQSTDVIPMEYTSIRNIVNRLAEANDGYKVLYAMLELVHPALQRDAVMLPPRSKDCDDDIHLYTLKFDAWLRYETYANRPYSPREQVNKFINELSPTFAPAISRVRHLLDTWNPYDNTTQEVLKITALPNTIERLWLRNLANKDLIFEKSIRPIGIKCDHRLSKNLMWQSNKLTRWMSIAISAASMGTLLPSVISWQSL
jgi:hypothetical protein